MAFTCNQCPSTFTEATNLNRHIRTKHSNKSFKCERCEFSSARSDKLKKHIESKHYGNKVKCPHCAFECDRNDSLTRHVKTYHEVPKDPLAPTPNFDWVEDIEQEEREVKHKCNQCNAEFKEGFNLNKHINSVHAKEQFACEHCAQIFNRKDNLMRHLPVHKKVKKIKAVPKKYALFDEPSDSKKSCFGEKYTKNPGRIEVSTILLKFWFSINQKLKEPLPTI